MKKIIYIFILSIFCNNLFACNIKFKNFGSSPDSLKINPPPLSIQDPIGGFNILTSISSLCPQNKELFGTMVSLFYIDNELVEIRLERYNKDDRALMELGILRYGNFKRSLGLDRNKWQGTYTWENSDEIINYLATSIPGGSTEILNITSKKNLNKISEYFLKKEQWKK
jgi:hypothetical protein